MSNKKIQRFVVYFMIIIMLISTFAFGISLIM